MGAARCRFIALPLEIDGADGSPVRAIALVD
jgi:kynurenine formamidase